MELLSPPDSVDVQDFQFKLQRKLAVFNDGTALPKGPCNLLAAASYYGLVFIGTPRSSLLVYHLKDLVDRNIDRPLHRSFPLPSCPEFVSLSCDQQLLAVIVNKDNAAVALIYNVKDFDKENVGVSREIRLSPTPGASIRSLQWNPCQADTLAVCCSAGSLAVYQLKHGSLDAQSKPANATCLCWSPKGKQIVTGNKDGTLSQYKPDLSLVKEVKAPQIFPSDTQALAIHWVSNYQYVVVFRDPHDEDGRPNLTIINTPKGGTPSCINYDDICFSMGNQRPSFYYLWQIMNWNVILASSSNSMEVGVLGSKDANNWQHWTQVDEARAELPLTDKKQESYPIGLAFDTAAIHQIPWGESSLPPQPMVHLLSQSGLLVTFNVINLSPAAVQICSPPLQLLRLPQNLLTSETPEQPAQEITHPNDAPQPEQEVQTPITSTPVVPKAQSIFAQVPNQAKPAVATKLFQPTPAEPPRVSKSSAVTNFGFGSARATPEISTSGFGVAKPEVDHAFGLQTSQPSAFAPPQPNQQRQAPVQTQPISAKATQSPPQSGSAKVTQATQQMPRAEPKGQKNNTGSEEQYKAAISARATEDISTHLLEEANNFQHELYHQLRKWRDLQIVIGSDEDIERINSTLHEWDPSELRGACDVQQLKDSVDEMKAELVRACAVLAEASSRPDAHELELVNRPEPVLASRAAALQRLHYYVQSQLQHASRALDQRWQADRAHKSGKGDGIRLPGMDNVYQTLVRQQEVLSKQKCTLAEYRRILKTSGFHMDSQYKLLNANAFDHNANDTLHKLSKNMQNMSLEQSSAAVARYDAINQQHMKISPSKINDLRNLLTAHQIVKIKPVRIEVPSKSMDYSSRKKQYVPTNSSVEVEELRQTGNTVSKPSQSEIDKITKVDMKMVQVGRPQAKPFAPISSGKEQRPATFKDTASPGDYFAAPATTPLPPVIGSVPRCSDAPAPSPRASDTFMGQNICSPTIVTSGSGSSPFAFNITAKSPTPSFGLPAVTAASIAFGSKTYIGNAKQATTIPKTTPLTNVSKVPSSIDLAKPTPTKPITMSSTQPSGKTLEDDSSKTGELQVSAKELNSDKHKSVAFGSSSVLPKANSKTEPQKGLDNNVERSVFGSTSSSALSTPSVSSAVSKEPTKEEPNSTAILETISQVVTTPTSTFSFTQKFSESLNSGSISTPPMPASSVFSTTTVKPETASVTSSAATSLFASANKNLSQTSIFGVSADSTQVSSKTQPGIVGSSENITHQTNSQASIFGGSSDSKPADSKPEIAEVLLGANQPNDSNKVHTELGTKLFGSNAESKLESAPTPLFGGSAGSKPSETSIFGTANMTDKVSVISAANSPPSLFGNPNTSSAAATSTPGTTAVSSVFGCTSSAASPASIFAAANAAASKLPAPGVFGGGSTTTNPVFGSQPASSPAPAFGAPTPAFGSPAMATSTSVFGTPASTASVFGAPAPPTTGSSIFGSSPAQSMFGSPAATSGPVFGSSQAGEVTNLFGSASLGAGPGAGAAAGSPFGAGATFGQAQSGGSIFGNTPSTPSSGFGSFSKPVTSGTSIFGGSSSPGAFGGGAFSSPAAPGPFSGGTSPASAFGAAPAFGSSSVFGSKPAFGQPSGFGVASSGGTFGAAPAFGSPPAFGAAPAFGATPSFGSGSPVKFGSSSPGFGAPTQQSSTFENLAGQNTIGFGNLAQHTPTNTFNKSPSFSNWR